MIRKNYRLGLDIYVYGNTMSVQCRSFADSINFLEKEYSILENSQDDVPRHSFDNALRSVLSQFGTADLPFLDEARREYIELFEMVYQRTCSDEGLREVFTGVETDIDMYRLRKQMEIIEKTFVDFNECYNKMSEWERCFTPWKKVRKEITDIIRIPNT